MTPKPCATCAYLRGTAPMLCGLLLDPINTAPRLCTPLRLAGGHCGPEGAFWQSATGEARPTATILPFSQTHRTSA